jgi:hypothetical protein
MADNKSIHGSQNAGIQANIVQADVLAVGYGAQATKHSTAGDPEALARAVAQLREAIDGLALQPAAREVLERDVHGLAAAASLERPDANKAQIHLEGIADKLKMVGVVLTEVVGLVDPATRIANLLRIPLAFLTGGSGGLP